jgi:hypothetical protein
MKTAELRQKDVAGLEAEVKELQKGPFQPAHAEGHATTEQHQPAARPRAARLPVPRRSSLKSRLPPSKE